MAIKHRILLSFLIISISNLSNAAKFRNDLPHIRLIEIRPAVSTKLEVGETEQVIEKPPNSNIIVGEDILPTSKLVLECISNGYPVQWVYSGDGMPEYSTNTSTTKTPEEHTRPDPIFIASMSLGFGRPIASTDSGKFTCISLQYPELSVYYYLYVTDELLFSNPGGEEILYKPTDPSVRIPCSVSNPKAVVSLQKSVNGLVQCPLNESITYDANKGFELKVSSYFDPAGVYVCTAGYNNSFQVVRYTLVPEAALTPSNIVSRSCQKNDDCASNQACIADVKTGGYSCTSPCSHVCGGNTNCETVNHVPRCYCLPGYRGDAYKACFPNVPPQPDRIEKDPCHPTPCGQYTQCERIGSTQSRCSCAPGYQGDPYVRCYQKDVCTPNPCGQNSDCAYRNGYASCTCRSGYFGQPPYCRAECETERHCAFDRTCVYGRCRNPCEGACNQFANTECRVIRRQAVCARIQTRCPTGYYGRDCTSIYTKQETSAPRDQDLQPSVSPCSPFPCGKNAECLIKNVENSELNRTSQVALCQCPPKFTGNADVECYPVEEQLARNDSEDIASVENTTTAVEEINSVNSTSECRPECGINATCKNGVCDCQKNFQGNPYIKCLPVSCETVEDCETPDATCVYGKCHKAGSVPEAKACGLNAISIVSEGKSICSCPSDYTGIATIECHLIKNDETFETNMEVNGTNLTTIGEDGCSKNPCGINADCIKGQCQCIKPFEGNPLIGCELNCTKNEDCPTTLYCYDISHKCVDPCDPNYQPFFTIQCGRDAKCKVNKEREAVCYCPETHPHGSPHLHCKEEAWMPNHRISNSTCQNKNNLKCGENSACKRFHDSNEYCVCLPGFFGDPTQDKGCQLGLQCKRDVNCRSDEECVNGKCLNVCRKQNNKCGSLAGCRGEKHTALCTCHIGTIQNSEGQCVQVMGALAERLLFRSYEDFK